ncbi:hypothetical protein SAY87_020227 [Trapa incisa]|uniref:Uncharacterized protein n=1 Tax=Trapa incisa TaxID=236973 RepID=A0AAN7Q3G4_9MYRT|nr:hypothetical protein SAY87_020227 [Trapa incisa]
MEGDRGLDLTQPFLSVRRFSPVIPPFESEGKSRKSDRKLPIVPQPPPYRSELKSGPLRKAGTVPFTWERSPGRPKKEEVSRHQSHLRPPIAPKLPPGRTPNSRQYESQDQALLQPSVCTKPQQDESSRATGHSGKDIGSKEDIPADNLLTKHESCNGGPEVGKTSGSEVSEEAYFDAPDILSRSESFYNCSISGLSGLDDADSGSQRSLSMDPQVQDFMMGRFLPAAKAMASGIPSHSHAPRKQASPAVAREQQPQGGVKKASNMNKQRPGHEYNPRLLSHYLGQPSGFESEDDKLEPDNSTLKVCGLLPRYLLKSSFCVLETAQGVATRNVKKINRKGNPSKTTGLTHKRDRSMQVSAQNRHFPSKIELPASHSIGKEAKEKEKRCSSFRDLLASEGIEWESPSGWGGTVMERTLYIDSVQTGNSHCSDMSPVSGPPSYRRTDFDISAVEDKTEESAHIESLPQDIKEINIVDEEETPRDGAEQEQVDSVAVYSQKDGKSIEKQTSPIDSSEHEIKLICHTGEINHTDQLLIPTSSDYQSHNSCPSVSAFHIPPLLPKSPAESWLSRTLPSVASRYSPAHCSPGSQATDGFQTSFNPPSSTYIKKPIIKTIRPSLEESLVAVPES